MGKASLRPAIFQQALDAVVELSLTTFQHSAECWNVKHVWLTQRMKSPKQLERCFKGVANHRRIAILRVVEQNEGIAVEELAGALGANMKTISQHTRSLVQAGLLNKRYRGRQVAHSLSPYGRSFLRFMRTF